MKDRERDDIGFAIETMKVFETFNAWRDGVFLLIFNGAAIDVWLRLMHQNIEAEARGGD